MMRVLLTFLYNFLIILAFPVVWVVAVINKKLRGSLAGQRELWFVLDRFKAKRASDPRPVIWLHAASAGEFEQLQPVLDRLRQRSVLIFQTFTSSTIYYKAFTDKRFDGVAYLPWDLPWRVNRFVKRLTPDLFINTRHDLWPNLLLTLRRRGIRSIFINANLYPDSLRLKPWFRGVNRWIFSNLSAVYTISDSVSGLLQNLYDGPLQVSGDTRFDRVAERAARNAGQLIPNSVIGERPVVIYGSVLPSDLDVVVPAIVDSLKIRDALHVIVPHETRERDLTPWEVALFRRRLKAVRYSELDRYRGESVLIWNSVGQLADLYTHATLAYVGAGFGAGVHSVTEPAIYQVPAAHGPSYQILAEAVDLVTLGISTVVQTGADLAKWLELLDQPDELKQKRDALALFVAERVGATDRILTSEQDFLPSPAN